MMFSNHYFVGVFLAALTTSTCLAVERAYIALPNQVMTFDKSGTLLDSFATTDRISDIAVNELGEIFVLSFGVVDADFVSRIDKFDMAGNFSETIVTDVASNTHLLGLTIGPDQNLYVGRNGATDSVERFTQDGDALASIATISTPVPGAPFAIVFDSSENFYVTDSNLIEGFSSDGQSLGTFATINPSLASFVNDLDIDSQDNVYAAVLAGEIEVFDASGISQRILDPQNDKRSIAIDSDDILYVAGGGSGGTLGSVETFLGDGTPLGTFVSGLPGEPIDMVFATVIPEPNSLLIAVLMVLVSCTYPRRQLRGFESPS